MFDYYLISQFLKNSNLWPPPIKTRGWGCLKHVSDVTLVCEDREQLEAHKVILAAQSPFIETGQSKKGTLPPQNVG